MLEGSRGAGYMGDIALDDLFLNTGTCPPSGMNSYYILHDLHAKISSFSITCCCWLILFNSYATSHSITKTLGPKFLQVLLECLKKCYEGLNPLMLGQTHFKIVRYSIK